MLRRGAGLIFLGLGASALLPDPVFAARGTAFAAAALLLLSVRNAWDLVTALAMRARQRNGQLDDAPDDTPNGAQEG